ncbi:MAG: hypothetical protein A3F54_05635 [Candidatus Kerfeldbacteria bacterium RIFCSPHIGHO2_12_FULL_48_17]|uniref:Uncharacterized protein n=1 Tax=Candidatus Kerfeldbacteria bacterium RIFCSPHIGHO2_12_FULL_48_17 TaxID=1798542 RepID=A0A1G2B7G8_9BACT|nr:MAG: hypothetical protein A3F54_05635 [Candidatus Kerfeldbacteria bacterium RIFCSPHIGHO2_12_FULL_48_17]
MKHLNLKSIAAAVVLLLVALSWVNEVRGQDLEISETPVEEVNKEYILVLNIIITFRQPDGTDLSIEPGAEIQVRIVEVDNLGVTYELERASQGGILQEPAERTRPFFRIMNAERVERIFSLKLLPDAGNWSKYQPLRDETTPEIDPIDVMFLFIYDHIAYSKKAKEEGRNVENNPDWLAVAAKVRLNICASCRYKKSFSPSVLFKAGNSWLNVDPNYFATGGPDFQLGLGFNWQRWFFNSIYGDVTAGPKILRNSTLDQDITWMLDGDISFSLWGMWFAYYFSGEGLERGLPNRYMEIDIKHQFHPQWFDWFAASLGFGIGKTDYEIGDVAYGYWKFIPFVELSAFTTGDELVPKQHSLRFNFSLLKAGNIGGLYGKSYTAILVFNF